MCRTTQKQGRLIHESDTTHIDTRAAEGRSTLLLQPVTAYQSGKYTVEVMNEHGRDVAAASVAVEGIPEAPGGRPCVSQGPDRVSLAWCGPPYDGGCMLTGFVYAIAKERGVFLFELNQLPSTRSRTVSR